MADKAKAEQGREKAGTGGLGNQLSIKGRRFSFEGENLGRTFKGVVIDFAYVNTYYKGKYSEDKVNIPVCFALSEDGEDMKPHKNSSKKQAKTCESCPNSKWQSAPRGRGKACQERRRLAVIHEGDLEDVENAVVAYLSLPVTSVKNWSKYVKECEDKLNRPVYSVVVELSFDEDEEWPVVVFTADHKIKDKKVVKAIEELREEVAKDLLHPFDAGGTNDDNDDDDDEDDAKPTRRRKLTKHDENDDDEDDEDDEDEDDDEDDEDDEEDVKKKGRKDSRRGKSRDADDDEDDDDNDDEDEDEDDERSASKRKGKKGKGAKSGDERPRKRKKSRFGK